MWQGDSRAEVNNHARDIRVKFTIDYQRHIAVIRSRGAYGNAGRRSNANADAAADEHEPDDGPASSEPGSEAGREAGPASTEA